MMMMINYRGKVYISTTALSRVFPKLYSSNMVYLN